MAINTFATLKSAITNWVVKSYDDDRLTEFVALGEATLNRELRIRDMEVTSDLSLTASTQTVSLPTRYVGARRLYLDGDPVKSLDYMPPVDFWQRYVSSKTSKPDAYTVEGDTIVFGPIPDTTYTGKFLYYQAFEGLSDSNTTNDLLTNSPDVYLAACLVWAFTFKAEDAEVNKWAGILRSILDSMNKSDEHDRYPPGLLVRRNDSGVP